MHEYSTCEGMFVCAVCDHPSLYMYKPLVGV